MSYPLVSICMSSYNNEKYVVETLNSIAKQTYPNLELVIVDDCSSDASVEVIIKWLKTYSQPHKLVCHEKNMGVCRVANALVENSSGKYISIIASDDLMLPEKVSHQVEIMEAANPSVALVYGDAYLIGSQGEDFFGRFIQWHRHFFTIPEGHIFPELIGGNFIPAMSILWKKECIEAVGMFDESLPYEDYDMLLRLSLKYDFIFSDFISVKYRVHNTNLHKKLQSVRVMEANFSIFYKHLNTHNKAYDSLIKERLVFYLLRMYDLKSEKMREYFKEYYDYFKDNEVMKFALSSGLSYYHLVRVCKVVKRLGIK